MQSVFFSLQLNLLSWKYVLTNPSAIARIWYKVIFFFKRSKVGLNSEFSFSCTGSLTNAKELILLYYLPIAGGGNMDLCLT